MSFLSQVLFCKIPKSGLTTTLNLLAEAASPIGQRPENAVDSIHHAGYMSSVGIKGWNSFNASAKEHILQTYTKFMVVRHPLKRLVSAYWDKMSPNVSNRHYRGLGRQVFAKHSPNATASEVKAGMAQFQDFVSEIMEGMGQDKHWRAYSRMCAPCYVHWDYIVKLESYAYDIKPILQVLSEGDSRMEEHLMSLVIPQNAHSPSSTTSTEIREMFNLTTVQHQAMEQRYASDMQRFGYTYDSEMLRPGYGNAQACEWKTMDTLL